ncbi:hypothetical protein ACFQGT_00170 [Natrialbaceae archaeon GCM10025810]
MPTCDYCDTEELAYDLESDRGTVTRCIPCLAIEQAQQQLSLPFEAFIDFDSVVYDSPEEAKDARRRSYDTARDWMRILARIRTDEPILERDPDAMGTVNDGTRTFLTNIMGSAAHYRPSEIVDADGHPGQTTLTEGSE